MYGAIDPIYMIMLMKLLGPEYIVWDKAATIQFKKPGQKTLYARFVIRKEELEDVHKRLSTEPSINRTYQVDLTDSDGEVYASFEKTLYMRRKDKTKETK